MKKTKTNSESIAITERSVARKAFRLRLCLTYQEQDKDRLYALVNEERKRRLVRMSLAEADEQLDAYASSSGALYTLFNSWADYSTTPFKESKA